MEVKVRKDHGWEGTLAPHLDPRTPAHLDHLCPLVTRIGLFDRLGAAGEDVFEETPVRSTTQEIFTHRHESGQINYGIWSEMVKLSPKEVQKTPEERMGRPSETLADVGGKQNALTLLRLEFGLVPRQPP